MKFLVVKEAYEYNDEEYTQPEGDPYNIVGKLHDTREEATLAAADLNEKGSFESEEYDTDQRKWVPCTIYPYRVEEIEE